MFSIISYLYTKTQVYFLASEKDSDIKIAETIFPILESSRTKRVLFNTHVPVQLTPEVILRGTQTFLVLTCATDILAPADFGLSPSSDSLEAMDSRLLPSHHEPALRATARREVPLQCLGKRTYYFILSQPREPQICIY